MKNLAILILLCLGSSLRTGAQRQIPCDSQKTCCYCIDCEEAVMNVQRKIESMGPTGDQKFLQIVTWHTFNRHLGKKLAYYLSGSSDLSLFRTYFLADVAENRAELGYNKQFGGVNGALRHLATVAVQANAANKFVPLFSQKDLSGNIGISLKYTYFTPLRKLSFTAPQRYALRQTERDFLASRYLRLNEKVFYCNCDSLQDSILRRKFPMTGSDPVTRARAQEENSRYELINQLRADDCRELTERTLADFYALEESYLSDPAHSVSMYVTWVTLQAYIPVTANSYEVASSITQPSASQDYRGWMGRLTLNGLLERGRHVVRGYVGGRLQRNNSIAAEMPGIESYSNATYLPYFGNLINKKATALYLGAYETFWSPSLQAQLVYTYPFSSGDDRIGLSVSADQYWGRYDPLNVTLGIPFFLRGREKGVNIELQVRATDLSNTVLPGKAFDDKVSIGFSLAVPFGNLVY